MRDTCAGSLAQQPTPQRQLQMRRFKWTCHAQRFLSNHGAVNHLIRLCRNGLKAEYYRRLRGRGVPRMASGDVRAEPWLRFNTPDCYAELPLSTNKLTAADRALGPVSCARNAIAAGYLESTSCATFTGEYFLKGGLARTSGQHRLGGIILTMPSGVFATVSAARSWAAVDPCIQNVRMPHFSIAE